MGAKLVAYDRVNLSAAGLNRSPTAAFYDGEVRRNRTAKSDYAYRTFLLLMNQ